MGKGSRRRKCLIDKEVFDKNWEQTFQKKEKDDESDGEDQAEAESQHRDVGNPRSSASS